MGDDAIQLATLLMMFEGACKIAALQKSKAVVHRFSVNYVFLKTPQNSQGTSVLESLFNRVAGTCMPKACNCIGKVSPAQLFFYEFFEILRTSFSQNTSGWLLLKVGKFQGKQQCLNLAPVTLSGMPCPIIETCPNHEHLQKNI